MTNREFDRRRHMVDALASIGINSDDAMALRRCSMTLHRWGERECGDGNGCIERDDETGIPYWRCSNSGKRWKVRDMEKGALKRIAAICGKAGVYYYHQTDPRGCALYVSRERIEDATHSRGIAVY